MNDFFVNRHGFRKLTIVRLEEARTLLEEDRFAGCNYLSGYVAECGRKVCIAKLTKRYDCDK